MRESPSDISLLLALRRVLRRVHERGGAAQALVVEMRGEGPSGKEVARRLLLGSSLSVAVAPVEERGEEVAMLASLISKARTSSTAAIGDSGEGLSLTLEKWLKARENRKLEDRVMRFRGIIASIVLGAVSAMIATLGPLVNLVSFTSAPASVAPGGVMYAAFAMACISSAMLGLYLSGRNLVLNVAATIVTFAVVAALVAPLVAMPSLGTLAIK